MTLLSIVIPARNAAADLERCLRAINRSAAAAETAVDVVVANNGSLDNTAEVARRQDARVLDVPDAAVSAVRNQAAKAIRTPIVAFVDADQEVSAGWVEAAVMGLAEANVDAVGADYRSPPSPTWVQRAYDALRRRPARRCETSWLPSGNLVIRRDAFLSVGGFDESLETCEDVDLCRRLHAAGRRVVAEPDLVSVHHGDPRTLGALFRGEMWRGRDNLRVTLRSPRDIRSVLSALQPLTTVLVAIAALAASLAAPGFALTLLAGFGAFLILASIPRAIQMWTRVKPRSPAALIECAVVALTFDTARALALVVRASHAVRHHAVLSEAR
jgi:GT2 family glycosyltransferase